MGFSRPEIRFRLLSCAAPRDKALALRKNNLIIAMFRYLEVAFRLKQTTDTSSQNFSNVRRMRNSLQLKLNLLLALSIAAMVTYWVLQFDSSAVTGEPVVAVATSDRVARTQPLDTGPMARLFGASSPVRSSSQIKLIGFISHGGEGSGVALLSANGRPAAAFRVGETVNGDMTLTAVNEGHVLLQQGDELLEVTLPERTPPAGINPAP